MSTSQRMSDWLKACDKEFVLAVEASKGWFPEHVFVMEDRIYLGATDATGIVQRFGHNHNGANISYTEYVEDAKVSFTVETDHKFKDSEWAAIWLTAERNGIGADRSQGFGKFTVVEWEPLT